MRLRAQKWNVGPERRKGLGTSRAFVWGNARHFCEAEPDYTGYEGERSGLKHWTRITQGTACSRAAILGSGRQSCEPEFNSTGCEAERQKQRMISQCEVILLLLNSKSFTL